jgi:hypothetical protein
MKLIKLSLSDSAYNKALEFAAAHAVPMEAYISSEIEDLLDRRSKFSDRQATNDFLAAANKVGPAPSLRTTIPVTLGQVLDVSAYVYNSGGVPKDESYARRKFKDAVHRVAETWKVGETSVRDKCCSTRRLGLPDVQVDTDRFVQWLCRPELLRDHLCRKFPNCTTEIHRRFADWLPANPSAR